MGWPYKRGGVYRVALRGEMGLRGDRSYSRRGSYGMALWGGGSYGVDIGPWGGPIGRVGGGPMGSPGHRGGGVAWKIRIRKWAWSVNGL